jgi:lipopolysaccharide/colanic/teichoic acid biosynthesis glycosyltransferase
VSFGTAGGNAAGRARRRLARILCRRSRNTDEVGEFDDGQLCAILPDTGAFGAGCFARSVCALAAARGVEVTCVLYTYPGERGDGPGGPPPGSRGRGAGERSRRGGDPAIPSPIVAGEVEATLLPHASAGFLRELGGSGAVRPLEPLLAYRHPRWKRCMDVAGAGALLVLGAPVMLVTAAAIKLSSPGPVIFRQVRAGIGGRPFTIYKFRTMVVGAEAHRAELAALSEQDGPAFKLRADPRVTRLGRLLRKTSLDELPQLINILKGDMSLVGPRPLPVMESDACEPWQRRRLEITPGLTCIWQVKGRSKVSFDEWVRMDMQYHRRRTLWHDLKILLLTLPAVILRRGAH